MEGQIFNGAVHTMKEGLAYSYSQNQKSVDFEYKATQKTTSGFLWMSSGVAIIGTTIYLLSLFTI